VNNNTTYYGIIKQLHSYHFLHSQKYGIGGLHMNGCILHIKYGFH